MCKFNATLSKNLISNSIYVCNVFVDNHFLLVLIVDNKKVSTIFKRSKTVETLSKNSLYPVRKKQRGEQWLENRPNRQAKTRMSTNNKQVLPLTDNRKIAQG